MHNKSLLCVACNYNCLDMVKLLINLGARINAKDGDYSFPLNVLLQWKLSSD
jgi:ankyrin repeat protein